MAETTTAILSPLEKFDVISDDSITASAENGLIGSVRRRSFYDNLIEIPNLEQSFENLGGDDDADDNDKTPNQQPAQEVAGKNKDKDKDNDNDNDKEAATADNQYGYEIAKPDSAAKSDTSKEDAYANRFCYGGDDSSTSSERNRSSKKDEEMDYGYGDGAPDVAANKYEYGDAAPTIATSKYGYGEAAPDLSAKKYGYEAPSPHMMARKRGSHSSSSRRGSASSRRASATAAMPRRGSATTASRRLSASTKAPLPSGSNQTPRRSSMKQQGAPRRASISYTGEVVAYVPGEANPVRRRTSISFADNADVQEVAPVMALADEPGALWYQDTEYANIKQKIKVIVQYVDSFHKKAKNGVVPERVCTRGLERHMAGGQKSIEEKFNALDFVLDEQDLQRDEGHFDESSISQVYQHLTSESKHKARLLAVQDAKDIEKYTASTRRRLEMFRRSSM